MAGAHNNGTAASSSESSEPQQDNRRDTQTLLHRTSHEDSLKNQKEPIKQLSGVKQAEDHNIEYILHFHLIVIVIVIVLVILAGAAASTNLLTCCTAINYSAS
eukprot:scaffold2408_cov279-Chaetoceros_neogracile.AAC.11